MDYLGTIQENSGTFPQKRGNLRNRRFISSHRRLVIMKFTWIPRHMGPNSDWFEMNSYLKLHQDNEHFRWRYFSAHLRVPESNSGIEKCRCPRDIMKSGAKSAGASKIKSEVARSAHARQLKVV